MRILRVIHSLDPKRGGLVSWLDASSQAILKRGHAVTVLCLDAPEASFLKDKPYTVVALGPALGTYGYTGRLLSWLKENRDYDCIIIEGLWQYLGLAVHRASAYTGVPYLVYAHGMLDSWFNKAYPLKALKKYLYWWLIEYRVLSRAAAVIFTSKLECEAARRSFWPYHCKEAILPLGVEPLASGFQPYRRETGEHRTLLFFGRIHPKKGLDLLLDAWHAALLKASQRNLYRLCLAGPSERRYLQHLQAKAKRLGIEGSLEWLGMQEGRAAKLSLFQSCEAFILPSYQENFALSLVESLAASRPVLITDAINTWPIVAEKQAGLVAPPTEEGVQNLIESWMSWGDEESTAFSRRAYECFQAQFQLDAAVDQVLNFISSL